MQNAGEACGEASLLCSSRAKRRTGAWTLKKRVVKYCLASKPRCLSNILRSSEAGSANVARCMVHTTTNAPAALELVVIEVHHAVAAARDRGQELALANLLVRAVALGAHRRTLLRLALQWFRTERVCVSARRGAQASDTGLRSDQRCSAVGARALAGRSCDARRQQHVSRRSPACEDCCEERRRTFICAMPLLT